jgi:molybdate transport system regulatory protein
MVPARTSVKTTIMTRHRAHHAGRDQPVRRNISGLSVRTKVWLERDGRFVIGEGGRELLDAIATLGSLRAGADRIGWSYRHAWGYLRNAERITGVRLTRPIPGKGRTRGTALTTSGETLRRLLLSLSRRAASSVTPPQARSTRRAR